MFAENHPVTGFDLWVWELSSEPIAVTELVVTPFNASDARFSPNDRWVAYTSDRTGRSQVYVRSFPTDADKTAISVDGGTEPRWANRPASSSFVTVSA